MNLDGVVAPLPVSFRFTPFALLVAAKVTSAVLDEAGSLKFAVFAYSDAKGAPGLPRLKAQPADEALPFSGTARPLCNARMQSPDPCPAPRNMVWPFTDRK